MKKFILFIAISVALFSGTAFALEEMTILGFPFQPSSEDIISDTGGALDAMPAGTGGGLSSLAFTADGSKAYTITTDYWDTNLILALDPVTGEGTLVAESGGVGANEHVSDLAMQPGTGVLYGSYWAQLVTFDLTTGELTYLNSYGIDFNTEGLGFAQNGTLYYVAGTNLYTLNPNTGAILTTQAIDGEFMGLGVHPMTGVLYGASYDNRGSIYSINPTTGAITLVGSVTCPAGGTCNLHDLDFNPITGVMYGVMGGAGGDVYNPDSLPGAFVRWGFEPSNNVSQAVANQGNSPATGAAGVIESDTTLYMLFSGLGDDEDISNAVSQTLPLLIGSTNAATNHVVGNSSNIIKARNRFKRGLSSGDGFIGDKYLWLKPFSTWTSQDDSDGAIGYDADTYGFVLGFDADTAAIDNLGISFTYANSDIDSDSSIVRHNAEIESYLFSLYGSQALNDRTDLSFQADIGFHDTDGTRNILFVNSIANSNYDSDSYHIGAGITRKYSLGEKTLFSPSIYADYSYIDEDAYTETGAGILNLSVNSEDTEAFVTSFDALIAHEISEKSIATANLGFGYDLINEQSSITSAYAAAPTAVFTTKGIDPSAWSVNGGLGINYNSSEVLTISVNYDFEVKEDFDSHSISAKLSYAF